MVKGGLSAKEKEEAAAKWLPRKWTKRLARGRNRRAHVRAQPGVHITYAPLWAVGCGLWAVGNTGIQHT